MPALSGSMLLLCLLSLFSLANANTAPVITKFLYEVCEDTPPGNLAFTIEATDAENDPLAYSLVEASAIFRVEKNTGNVYVRTYLNTEENTIVKLRILVSDGPNETPADINVVLKDANNNKPLFEMSSYDISIPENTPVGSTLFRARATDDDTGNAGLVFYKIDDVIPSSGVGLFGIGDTNGEVTLRGSLNFTALSPLYQLRINATDGGGRCFSSEINYQSSIVFSHITVLDTPDIDPLFIGLPYLGRVQENSPMGQSVFQVTAIDPDTGINDDISYSIEDSTVEGLFRISEGTGVIAVSSEIDREMTEDIVTLTVKATESQPNIHGVRASSVAQVQIEIIDLNDNRPEFYKCGDTCVKADSFTGEVFEQSLGSISFNMTVKDSDKLSKIVLLLEGADEDAFSVVPELTTSESTVELLVKQPQKLDFEEKQQIFLQVIAIDEEEETFKSTATVTINIKDINDNNPRFPQDTYKLNVTENSPAGTTVAKITATDPDTMDEGKILYKLLPDSILPYFDVQPHTGEVYVKNGTLLDREGRSLYIATLQASDTDGKPGTTLLEISLTDINDQTPNINRDSYFVFVKEGEPFEIKIEATDADEDNSVNSQIVYRIVPSMYSDNFTIDPNTGVLRNNGEIDREALDPGLNGRIELNVTATDNGTPPLSDSVKVTIDIEDVNDNTPQFNASSYTFSVKEGEKGAYVGSVYAIDLDQAQDSNRISFSIIEGSFGSFIIRSFAEERGYRGDISVDPDIELDYESARKQFMLRVEATDLGEKKAEVMVEVNVLDVNDERPELGPTVEVTVKENTTITGAVGSFTGYDKDGNHSLVFKLESMKCRCSGSLTPCDSFILEPTGEVMVKPNAMLDYEQCDQAIIEAWAEDELTEKGGNSSATTGQMVIKFEDINDNAPEFIDSDSVFVVVSESASKGTSVAAVTATDRDSGINRQINFQVTRVQFMDINGVISAMRNVFEAITTQQKDVYIGIIQTAEALDISLKGKYLVTVSATDTGGLVNSTVLGIFNVDATYKVELEFTLSEAEVEEKLDVIKKALTAATNAFVEVVSIKPKTPPAARNSGNTIVAAYFIYPNGTALTSDQVEAMLSSPEHYPELRALGLTYIGNTNVNIPSSNTVEYILLGILGGLVIILAVLIISLMCTRRNYKRKLKASKAFNSAMVLNSGSQHDGPMVPGTNKFSKEGTNPVLNVEFNEAPDHAVSMANSDVEKMSVSSKDFDLDVEVDESRSTSDEESGDEKLPSYGEALGAALAERDQMKSSKKAGLGFSNAAFSTTDV